MLFTRYIVESVYAIYIAKIGQFDAARKKKVAQPPTTAHK